MVGMPKNHPELCVTSDSFDAVLFDLDGVLTATAEVHAAAWKKTFDEYLQKRATKTGETFQPFDSDGDYSLYVDGKPRYDGVRSFLDSRGIHLPDGDPGDPPDRETVCGIGNRKEELVVKTIETDGVKVYEGSVAWVRQLRGAGIKTAVVSSSKNTLAVLKAAGIDRLFDVRVDGHVVEDQGLPGKPAPDTYLHAAALLGVSPRRAVVVEDALSGVEAGKNGGFGLVIGVDRKGHADALRENGADLVVTDLAAAAGGCER
ncbi:MAG: HAD family hydrolase [Syntrophobacteraceae bacterium]